MTRTKVCGITNIDDAQMAIELGVDAIGFVFAPSQRYINPKEARAVIRRITPLVTTVGVFMDEELDVVERIVAFTGLDVVQLHGKEPASYCKALDRRIIKRIKVEDEDTTSSLLSKMNRYKVAAFLLDPGTGSGHAFDWSIAYGIRLPCIIAGGLDPDNVGVLVKQIHPYGVDVSSGVEQVPGKKDRAKIRYFIEEVKKCSLLVS